MHDVIYIYYIHTHIHTHTHARTHARTHTHTHYTTIKIGFRNQPFATVSEGQTLPVVSAN